MPAVTAQPADKRIELVLQQLEELPTLPTIAVKVLEITGNDSSNAKEVVELIAADPALSARILQLVHRADSGFRGEITSVERAVVMLGFEAVRSAVLAITIFKSFDNSRNDFWKHSVAVATAAEMIAEIMQSTMGTNLGFDPSEAFVAGLLHDLGKIALDVMLPKSFTKIVEAAEMLHGNIADIERSVVGMDHMVVGKRLAERWQLPQQIRECIWLHNQAPEALPKTVKNARLINLITLADHLARERHIGFSGNFTFNIPLQSLLESLGVSQSQIDPIAKNLVSRIAPRAEGLGLDESTSTELYTQALTQANRELGKMSTQLAMKSRKLNVRAKLFDTLNQFHTELKPDAPTQLIVQAIGQTAVSVLETKSLVAFSLPPEGEVADVIRFGEEGQALENYALNTEIHPRKPGEIVAAAGEELEWLLAEVSPELEGEKRYWLALQSDGEVIGGIVWGGSEKEIGRLAPQVKEIAAVAGGWALALRTAQIRDQSRVLSEQLAEANRQLQNAQAEALKTRTMVTVGEMAAGAAHEMNNPLMVISGRAQLLSQQLTGPQLKDAAQQISDQAQRLSEIITELMAFARPASPHPVEAVAANIITGALQQVKQRGPFGERKIEAQKATVPPIKVDPGQIEAALVEVIDNAIHATDPKRGQIAITTDYDHYSERVVITIADNGSGMDEKTLKRAFDPFFSAKTAGRRRGMGLAKAMRFIESSGGTIRLDSRVNQGTRVVILLPAAKPAQQSAPASRKAAT